MTEVPWNEGAYRNRARAEAFGAVAAAYDRYRPGYPTALIDDLVALRPVQVLDIGCGTGKAARLLAARGLPVLGVEIDAQMAAVARGHGIEVETAPFEAWDDRGRTFDLIVSGQAWHWVDPAVAAPKAARLLNPGGTLAVFWNYGELAADVRALVDPVYRRYAPDLVDTPGTAGTDDSHRRALIASGAFRSLEVIRYPFDREWTRDDWLGNLGTHSDHLLLGERRLAALVRALRAALATWTGPIVESGGTYTIYARP